MKRFIAKYILYIYLNLVKDNDMEIYKESVLPFIKVINFIRSIYIWVSAVIFFPIFMFGMIFEQNIVKNIKK